MTLKARGLSGHGVILSSITCSKSTNPPCEYRQGEAIAARGADRMWQMVQTIGCLVSRQGCHGQLRPGKLEDYYLLTCWYLHSALARVLRLTESPCPPDPTFNLAKDLIFLAWNGRSSPSNLQHHEAVKSSPETVKHLRLCATSVGLVELCYPHGFNLPRSHQPLRWRHAPTIRLTRNRRSCLLS